STLDFIHTKLASKIDPADRKDVSTVLRIIKEAAVETAAGQLLDKDTTFEDLITDLPLQPGVLTYSAVDIAQMDAEKYKTWLTELKKSQKRAELLMQRKEWIEVADYSTLDPKDPKGRLKERYLFLLE